MGQERRRIDIKKKKQLYIPAYNKMLITKTHTRILRTHSHSHSHSLYKTL